MSRGYQHDFSQDNQDMYDVHGRQRKARTMAIVIDEVRPEPLATLNVLNAGGSTGYIDAFLADQFRSITCIDIDEHAIAHARNSHQKDNLTFEVGDVLAMDFEDNQFDIVISSHVYEHVADANLMMDEIFRVLKPGGMCYFAAMSRFMLVEPHYGLPLLSLMPRPLAHLYMRLAKKGRYYYEKHISYWGMRKLVNRFQLTDYTARIIANPERYAIEYMLPKGSVKWRLARFMIRYCYAFFPGGYIWILKKPE